MADSLSSTATTCCIVGGGPAGMMLGLLLARSGVEVQVLEKHADFNRDFRGDTIHPSTMEVLQELDLLDQFLDLPHQRIDRLALDVEGQIVPGPDFSRLSVRCPYIAIIPQWDFLNFLSSAAERYPGFQLRMQTRAHGLIEEGGRVAGVRATTDQGELEIRADLVIGADGRHSTVREVARLPQHEIGVPIDVLWFRLPKRQPDSQPVLGHIHDGKIVVTIDRGDYYQCGDIIPKGEFEEVRQHGLDRFRHDLASAVPFLAEAVHDLADWDQVKLLTVQINRLTEWARPGLLCIGDAAHAMSPAGGVGINLAIQDAVATANLLTEPLRRKEATLNTLRLVQKRREWPTRIVQTVQAFVHRRMFSRRNGRLQAFPLSAPQKMMLKVLGPLLRRTAARFVGIGVRPEHVQTPAMTSVADGEQVQQ